MGRTPDVLVIGGGIIGCSVAYALACRGVRVTVLERDRVGSGAPRAAAGFVWPTMTSRTHDAWFDLCLAASTSYEASTARLHEETGLDPECRRTGALRVAAGGAERDELRGKGAWIGGGRLVGDGQRGVGRSGHDALQLFRRAGAVTPDGA